MSALVRCLACLLAVLAASLPGRSVAASAPDFIHTEGRRFVDARGRDFDLKGIGLGNWLVPEGYMFGFTRALAPHQIDGVIRALAGPDEADRFWTAFRDAYITRDDIDFIARAGFTAIRVPFHWKLFATGTATPALEGPGYALMDRLIGWCRETGLRVILDMHAAPGGETGVNHDDGVGYGLLFYVPRYQALTVAIWRKLAARYADEPAVLGYDLLNEPISPYLDEASLNPRLEGLYRRIATAIREVDRHHVLFVQGGQWASNFTMFGPPFDTNMAYSYHMFWADPVRASIAPMLDFSIARNVPLWLGESGELTDSWNARFVKLQEIYGISWSFWTFKNLASTSTVLSIHPVPGWDLLAQFGGSDPAGWPHVTPEMRARARSALSAYLAAMRLPNTIDNGCYLASLGLRDPLAPGQPCSTHPATPPIRVGLATSAVARE
jgi:endoglucanase